MTNDKKIITTNKVKSAQEAKEKETTKFEAGDKKPKTKFISTKTVTVENLKAEGRPSIPRRPKRSFISTGDLPIGGRKYHSPANPRNRGGRPTGAKDKKKRKTRDPVSTKRRG